MVCSIEGLRIQRSRFGPSFAQLLREVERRSQGTRDEIRDYRNQRLHNYVQLCGSHVPFYRKWFARNKLDPQDIQTLDDLRALPVLTKQRVQDHVSEFVSTAIPERRHLSIHTSGTTGAGLRFASTARAVREQWAVWWRYRRWHGLSFDIWCGYLGGRTVVPITQDQPPFWRYNFPGKQLLLSGYHMSPRNLPSYIDELRRRRPPWLHGYPSLLAVLARYVVDNKIDLGYQVRWITLGAENLLPHQAAVMERAFQIRPRQHYGMAEAIANISECPRGRLHVDEDFAAVEFVPTGRDGEHRVVGCSLSNPATALLRYDVGDLVAVSHDTCLCGRPGRMVDRVHGRQEDYIVLPNGTLVGRLDHAFKDMANVRESQLYQRRKDELIVRVARGQLYGDRDEDALLFAIRSRIGTAISVRFEYVDSVERSRTGKLRFVVSDLPEGRL